MKKIITVLIVLLTPVFVYSQVGIGTTVPTAEFEIMASPTGIPALKLNPQTSPLGTSTGQIAVIEDTLYLYDDTRGKWLSIESTALQFGYALTADNQVLWFGGDVGDTGTGALMPFDGTIVYVTAQSSGGNTSKRMNLLLNGTNIANNTDPNLSGRFNLSGGSFLLTSYNIDFNAGDYLSVKATANGAGVNDPTVIIWVKWRK